MWNDLSGADPDEKIDITPIVVRSTYITKEQVEQSEYPNAVLLSEQSAMRGVVVDAIFSQISTLYLSEYDKGQEKEKYVDGRIADMGSSIRLYSKEREELIKAAISDSLTATFTFQERANSVTGEITYGDYIGTFSFNMDLFGGENGTRDLKEFITQRANDFETVNSINEYTGFLDEYKKFKIAKVEFDLDVSKKLSTYTSRLAIASDIAQGNVHSLQLEAIKIASEYLGKKGISYLTKHIPSLASFAAKGAKFAGSKTIGLTLEFATMNTGPEFNFEDSLQKLKDDHYRTGLAAVFFYFVFQNRNIDGSNGAKMRSGYIHPWDGPNYSRH